MIAEIIGETKNNELSNSSKSEHTMSLFEHNNARSSRSPYTRLLQNFLLVWLDENTDEDKNNDHQNSITKLREIVNSVNTFTDVDECIDFITDIDTNKVVMISSGAFGQITIPIVHEQWSEQCPKIKGVFKDITPSCESLKKAVQECDQNTISMSFVSTSDNETNQNLDQLDQSFMYTQILKEILLTIDFKQDHFMEFITYCREQCDGNPARLKNVDKLEKEYHQHTPIWWYTCQPFLFSMLNRALRTMVVDLIIKLGFFMRDLHENITHLYSEQYGGHHPSNSFVVYRGQGVSQTDFDQLVKTKGGLLSFNNFLSTSLNRTVSLAFAESNQYNSDLIGVLFQISIDSSILSTPFASVCDVSYYKREEEILFSMHSIFRIGQIKQIDGNNRLWQIDLMLTNDNDRQLHALTEYIREETFPHTKGWYRLGLLLIKLGQFDKAQQVYDVLLDPTTHGRDEANIYHMLGTVKNCQGEYAEAITFYEKSHEIYQKTLSSDHPDLATSYVCHGSMYEKMGEYSKALLSHEKALEIYQKILPPNHPSLATSYACHGSVYETMGEYSKALSYYEKDRAISEKTLPPNHPDLAAPYACHGSVYEKMGEYAKALSFQEKALEIGQKTLPPNHPQLATSYNNIGLVYGKMDEYSKALSFHEKALEIYQKTLPANHPDLATSYNNIGGVYEKMGEYSKALSSYEKALEIDRKTLLPNHPDLAASYTNMGKILNMLGESSKALLFHEKALEIGQKTLPPNHPQLTTSYNNIGLVYAKMGEYSKALSFHEIAFEIFETSFPPNHPSLAICNYNIGLVYEKIDDYSKAFSFYKRAVDIGQNSLSANHPRVQLWKEKLESVNKKL